MSQLQNIASSYFLVQPFVTDSSSGRLCFETTGREIDEDVDPRNAGVVDHILVWPSRTATRQLRRATSLQSDKCNLADAPEVGFGDIMNRSPTSPFSG
jgi:hypothetical protein